MQGSSRLFWFFTWVKLYFDTQITELLDLTGGRSSRFASVFLLFLEEQNIDNKKLMNCKVREVNFMIWVITSGFKDCSDHLLHWVFEFWVFFPVFCLVFAFFFFGSLSYSLGRYDIFFFSVFCSGDKQAFKIIPLKFTVVHKIVVLHCLNSNKYLNFHLTDACHNTA